MLPVIFRGHSDAGFFAHALSLNPDGSPIVILPGNQRSTDARYVCFIIVKDFFRMRFDAGNAGDWHYSRIEPAILEDVRTGRAVLVFDLCNEGPAYEPDIFSQLYDWIEAQRLPAGRCVWLAQNRLTGAVAKAHSGQRASLVRFECYDYFIKIMAWVFSPLSPDSLGADPEAYIRRQIDADRKDKLLLCLNGTPRLQRVLTVAALRHHGLLDSSLVSFPGMRYAKSGASVEEVLGFIEQNPDLEYLRSEVNFVTQMPQLRADAFTDQGNALVEKIDPAVYERTFFSLVTESDFVDEHIERVTEKAAKAFCMGHPALIVGNAHSVQLMTDFGFQDWRGVIDRHPETESNPAKRFELLLAETLRLASQIRADPRAWVDSTREVSVYNFRHAVNGTFLRDFVKHIDRPIVNLLASLLTR